MVLLLKVALGDAELAAFPTPGIDLNGIVTF
jgi:hypothetical protein